MTVIGAGVTLHEALAAADLLKKGEGGEAQQVLDWAPVVPWVLGGRRKPI